MHLLQSRTDEAIVWLEKARSVNAGLSFVHAFLASAYALKGETDRAAAELAEARRLTGKGSYASIARIRTRLARERTGARHCKVGGATRAGDEVMLLSASTVTRSCSSRRAR